MSYVVIMTLARSDPVDLGAYEHYTEALTIARTHGAIGEPRHRDHHIMFSVEGHEGDDAYAILIGG